MKMLPALKCDDLTLMAETWRAFLPIVAKHTHVNDWRRVPLDTKRPKFHVLRLMQSPNFEKPEPHNPTTSTLFMPLPTSYFYIS